MCKASFPAVAAWRWFASRILVTLVGDLTRINASTALVELANFDAFVPGIMHFDGL